jgi:hypothetical protein
MNDVVVQDQRAIDLSTNPVSGHMPWMVSFATDFIFISFSTHLISGLNCMYIY